MKICHKFLNSIIFLHSLETSTNIWRNFLLLFYIYVFTLQSMMTMKKIFLMKKKSLKINDIFHSRAIALKNTFNISFHISNINDFLFSSYSVVSTTRRRSLLPVVFFFLKKKNLFLLSSHLEIFFFVCEKKKKEMKKRSEASALVKLISTSEHWIQC